MYSHYKAAAGTLERWSWSHLTSHDDYTHPHTYVHTYAHTYGGHISKETMEKCSGTQTVLPSRPPFYITPFTWKWPRYLFTWGVNLLVPPENKQQQEYTGSKDGSISTESDRAGEDMKEAVRKETIAKVIEERPQYHDTYIQTFLPFTFASVLETSIFISRHSLTSACWTKWLPPIWSLPRAPNPPYIVPYGL